MQKNNIEFGYVTDNNQPANILDIYHELKLKKSSFFFSKFLMLRYDAPKPKSFSSCSHQVKPE